MKRLGYLFLIPILAMIALPLVFSGNVGGNVIVSGNNAPVQVTISPTSNSFIAVNSQTWTATVIPGTPPYSYTWNVYAYNGALLATTTYAGNSYTSNAYTYTFDYGQTYYANVVVVDSVPNTANSVNSVIVVCYPTCSGTGGGAVPTSFLVGNSFLLGNRGFTPSVGLIYILIAIFTFVVGYELVMIIPMAVTFARRRK